MKFLLLVILAISTHLAQAHLRLTAEEEEANFVVFVEAGMTANPTLAEGDGDYYSAYLGVLLSLKQGYSQSDGFGASRTLTFVIDYNLPTQFRQAVTGCHSGPWFWWRFVTLLHVWSPSKDATLGSRHALSQPHKVPPFRCQRRMAGGIQRTLKSGLQRCRCSAGAWEGGLDRPARGRSV
ncbi:unnamed protein product [Notodromas monacha]|uniref:Uncharacterized protein n=1 Tax=Notodromas monacha TaxID=399045 RepID=A0A7R9BWS7_9CRUS|nr:unnamed protein product [Notodromas monacha]CAG0922832.1 unnamed protein product [Notodromas monacha]